MADIDPAVLEAVLNMQNQDEDPRAMALARQQAMANSLRGSALTPGEGRMAGRRYVGPGIADAVRQIGTAAMAGKMQQGIDQQQQVLGDQRVAGRKAYFGALVNALRKPGTAKPGQGSMVGAQAPVADYSDNPDAY